MFELIITALILLSPFLYGLIMYFGFFALFKFIHKDNIKDIDDFRKYI